MSTAVSPPEGFVADNDSLSEEVNSELEAVQFTIIDAGSLWVSTCVKHTVTHKKKKQEVYSNIGVKLTKRLAEEKGIDIWGEAEKAREDSQEYRECLHEFEQEAKQEEPDGTKDEKTNKGREK